VIDSIWVGGLHRRVPRQLRIEYPGAIYHVMSASRVTWVGGLHGWTP